jgi:uncharacterized protein DUF5662
VLTHKRWVFKACRHWKVPLWRALIHDWHKFLPSEWFPYSRTFYCSDGTKCYQESLEFAYAWNLHQKRARHHWQFWLITWDRGNTIPLEMPETYVREMVADWWGAGRSYAGPDHDLPGWFVERQHIITLHPNTETLVRELLFQLPEE